MNRSIMMLRVYDDLLALAPVGLPKGLRFKLRSAVERADWLVALRAAYEEGLASVLARTEVDFADEDVPARVRAGLAAIRERFDAKATATDLERLPSILHEIELTLVDPERLAATLLERLQECATDPTPLSTATAALAHMLWMSTEVETCFSQYLRAMAK